MWETGIALALTVLWSGAVIKAKSVQIGKAAGRKGKGELAKQLMTLPSRYVLEKYGLFDRIQSQLSGLHGQLTSLHGVKWTVEDSKLYVAAAVGYGYAAACGGAWLSVAGQESAFMLIGFVLAVVLPLAKWRDAASKAATRKQDMLLALPELLSKLMLLLGAGETVQGALMRCAVRPPEDRANPLQEELAKTCDAIRNGESFSVAIEGFSRRCAVQEVSLFTTTLLLNYRRGGDKLVLSLKELSYSLWEKRKSVARSRGEEASSKLVFPLVGIFVLLMILVASPAVLLMGL
ncbi:tight adherence protein C [Paenibacillus phyllosphaerae]|uniref:Tight adherence protein C n=1 Tax=Paenibacillus phyllosphaerae TaxID=274593 RepID=A0A7W5B1X6_9BACL|nr:type II secretion system F family protein [Paenibacillus phyllosphaerae]MBB3112923.1 tight adherence protein C [Paenibacillus phyllosphaerae]